LGGYDGIAAFVENLLPRLTADPQLNRFWKHRGEDGVRREERRGSGTSTADQLAR
jgi:hemoglobin